MSLKRSSCLQDINIKPVDFMFGSNFRVELDLVIGSCLSDKKIKSSKWVKNEDAGSLGW